MSPDDPALQPVIVLRVVIRSPDLETFVSKYSRFVKDDRIFIFTKSSQPPGTRVRFTLELADGQPLIFGEGTVTRIRPDTGDVSKPPGMELRFQPLDDPSRELVARMLRARELTGGQFRDESTDAQTRVRDGSGSTGITRDFDEAVPTLQPLEKTGAQPALSDDTPPPRQNESGAVTLAQGQPGERAPSPPPLPLEPPHPATHAATNPIEVSGDKHSGGFSTPTPLPAPIPAAPDEFGVSPPPTKLARPAPVDGAGAAAALHDATDSPFAAAGPAPAFAERFHAALPGAPPPSGAPPSGTVPANPFSEISDGAIEYFVEWSLEQSTAPKPKVAEASFANVPMATPKAEKRRTMRAPLVGGIAIGIFLGLPLGGAIVWFGRPAPRPIIVERMPEPTLPQPRPVAIADMATALAQASPDLATAPTTVAKIDKPAPTEKPAKIETPPATEKPAKAAKAELVVVTHPAGAGVSVDGEAQGKTPLTMQLPGGTHEVVIVRDRYATVTQSVELPAKIDVTLRRPTATLHVDSDPPGGEVTVEGKPRGKTPVDVTLDAFHHYDVQVTLLGTHPWHKRVSLKPPQTDVTAKLSVVHNP